MKARNFYIINDYSYLNLCPFLAQSVLIHSGNTTEIRPLK